MPVDSIRTPTITVVDDPTIKIRAGRVVIRSDNDPTAGPVWMVEHAKILAGEARRLLLVFSEGPPWGETVEWLLQCMSLVPVAELPTGVSAETFGRLHTFLAAPDPPRATHGLPERRPGQHYPGQSAFPGIGTTRALWNWGRGNGSGAAGRLTEKSLPAVLAEAEKARCCRSWGAYWPGFYEKSEVRLNGVREADAIRVRMMYDVVLWCSVDGLSITDEQPLVGRRTQS